MKIQLLNNKIRSLSLTPETTPIKSKKKNAETVTVDAQIQLNNEVYLNQKNKSLFRVRYKLSVSIPHNVIIEMEYDFDFKADEDVDQEIAQSMTIRSAVPNLVYPYIKVYVEQIMTMSGYGQIPLPFVDFNEHPLPANSKEN
ncbi:protein-export chaperone SecB [Citrobacter sp. wls757]|uniref:protein-export chaperone SecB n=1 Tax=Citrobacter sp. wls757 TaxID=2576417 RepID=UPI0014855678|nr:protein-export chaperone SecB [Citrobacter sp. wls757]